MLMAGIIAIIGDRVGRLVGRRRLSIFGLRPRHTSVVITVLTGVLIASASLGLMVALSTEVRLALFRIDEIQQTLARYRGQLAELQRELEVQQQLVEQANRARDEAVARSQQAVQQREQAEAELARAQRSLEELRQELQTTREQLAQGQRRLEEARRDLEFQVARVEQLTQLGRALSQRVEELQGQIAALESTERQLSEAIITLWNTAQRLQYESVAFQRGEIVLAAVIDGGGDRAVAQSRLLDFLKRVEAAARARMGSGLGGEVEGSVVRISPDEFDSAVDAMASGRGPWVVRARAVRNTLWGENVAVGLELIPRGLAFRRGQVVAQVVVDGNGQGQVEDRVLELLQAANQVAITYGGMVTGPDGTVGRLVSADEFARVVAELRRRQGEGALRVVAVAANDTFNTDGPLQIRLRVEPAEGVGS